MAKRDSKGRFVSNNKKYSGVKGNNKCTCKEAMKCKANKRAEDLLNGALGTWTIIDGFEVPLNPGFLDQYLEAMALSYPDSVTKISHDECKQECGDEGDGEPNVVICFGEEPYDDDDPDAPRPVWDKDTQVIHINARKPEETKVTEVKKRKTGKERLSAAAEHFRKLEKVSKKLAENEDAKWLLRHAVLPKEVQLALDIIAILRSLKGKE